MTIMIFLQFHFLFPFNKHIHNESILILPYQSLNSLLCHKNYFNILLPVTIKLQNTPHFLHQKRRHTFLRS